MLCVGYPGYCIIVPIRFDRTSSVRTSIYNSDARSECQDKLKWVTLIVAISHWLLAGVPSSILPHSCIPFPCRSRFPLSLSLSSLPSCFTFPSSVVGLDGDHPIPFTISLSGFQRSLRFISKNNIPAKVYPDARRIPTTLSRCASWSPEAPLFLTMARNSRWQWSS